MVPSCWSERLLFRKTRSKFFHLGIFFLCIHFYIFYVYVLIFCCSIIIALEEIHHCLYANCANTSPWSTISPNGQIHKWDISSTSKYIVPDNQKYGFKINLCSYTSFESFKKILPFQETLKNLTRIVVKCSAMKLLIFSGWLVGKLNLEV